MKSTAYFLLVLAGLMSSSYGVQAMDTLGQAPNDVRDDLSIEDLARVQNVTKATTDFSKAESFETMQGGGATSRKIINADSFSHFSSSLSFEQELDFKLGNALFRKLWVSSPSSTQASDGLGPLFNARSCQSCHLKDGRGAPPRGDAKAITMFLRLAIAAQNSDDELALENRDKLTINDPIYGGQFQTSAIPGVPFEGKMVVDYAEMPFTFEDGTEISLRAPTYSVDDLQYGPMHEDVTFSPRVAPPMIGLGQVEQIHSADIIALADPDDRDDDGISGRVSYVRHPVSGEIGVGRFGLKASNVTIRAQSAGAFAGDIGISSPDVPTHAGDCTQAQADCHAMPNGVQARLGETEAPGQILDLVTFYSQNLAVPQRRDVEDPTVLAGKKQFYQLGCIACHKPKFVTRRDAPEIMQSFQLIWPYSDFLLHDMGHGLSDGQQVGDADGYEWRTAPLWGIGLTQTVSGHTFFLHDGRARNLTEAIVWHGGEAETARDGFARLAKSDRDALLTFLNSL